MQIPSMTVIGLMSGTSLDGVDIAIVDIQKDNGEIEFDLRHFVTVPYEDHIKKKLEKIVLPEAVSPDISSMNMLLGEIYAKAILCAIQDASISLQEIDLISSHGQTIFHNSSLQEDNPYYRPNTLQIGDISVIAEMTGIATIGDFRTRDMAAGGNGAPLVPFLDYHLLKSNDSGRILVNIGGIANISVISPGAAPEDVIAYDTGPGNLIIDAFIHRYTKGEANYDEGGKLAGEGKVDREWLKELLEHPYYSLIPPKTTGREQFGLAYAEELWEQAEQKGISELDRITTVTELTAHSLWNSIANHIQKNHIEAVYVSGGGWRNRTMLDFLAAHLPEHITLQSTAELGIDSDAKEAIAFAVFGYLGFNKQPNNLMSATGARKSVVMGKISWGTISG